MEKMSNQKIETHEIDLLETFWNNMTPEMYELLDVYGFNNKGIVPELMLKIKDPKSRQDIFEKCREFKLANTEGRKKIALELAELTRILYNPQTGL